MKFDAQTFRITEIGKEKNIAFIVGLVGLSLSLVGFFVDADQFFFSYLTSAVFWLSIGLGALFVVILHYLTSALWSVVLRRLFENVMSVLPFLCVIFLPLLFGIHNLFHWSHADAVAHDHLLQSKEPFLNITFFIIRFVLYFVIWWAISQRFYSKSIQSDKPEGATALDSLKKISAPSVILFALSLTFFAFDWLMSMDPHWYSTIFGVYYFAGSTMSIFAFMSVIVFYLQKNGALQNEVTAEHRHDLGKLLFTFNVFWAYMAYSQYFLIWYGNIPEETIWFAHRWAGSYKVVSLVLVFGHFVLPFFILMVRSIKRTFITLLVLSLWLLLMHYVDIYWLVMPNLHHETAHFSWMDVTTMLGIGGLFLWMFWKKCERNPIVPVNDPRLQASINMKH